MPPGDNYRQFEHISHCRDTMPCAVRGQRYSRLPRQAAALGDARNFIYRRQVFDIAMTMQCRGYYFFTDAIDSFHHFRLMI